MADNPVQFIFTEGVSNNTPPDGSIIFDTNTKSIYDTSIDYYALTDLYLKYDGKLYKVHPQVSFKELKDEIWDRGNQICSSTHAGLIDYANYSKLLPFSISIDEDNNKINISGNTGANISSIPESTKEEIVQEILNSITTGSSNGTLLVGNNEVPVAGLRSAAFMESQTYEEEGNYSTVGAAISNWSSLTTDENNEQEGGE